MNHRRAGLFVVSVLVIVSVLAASRWTVSAQTMSPIEAGDTVTGEVKKTAPNIAQLYEFEAVAGDVVSATMVRKSGNLRPLIILADPTKVGTNELIMAQSELSDDGKSATLSEFTIEADGKYVLFATREGYDKGTTAGKYEMTFEKAGGDSSGQDTPTDTPVPTRKPRATPTRRPSPVPTRKAPATPTPPPSNANLETFEVGNYPSYTIWSGNNLYVANSGSGSVSILNESGDNLSTFSAGVVPFTLGWDGVRLWVADIGTTDKPGNSVLIFDAKGKKLSTFKVGKEPFSFSFDQENQRMWLSLLGENKVVALDFKGNVLLSIDVSEAGAGPNTVLWVGDQLWVTLSGSTEAPGNTLISIDTDGNITGTYTVGKSPADLAWDDENKLLFVANFDDDTVTVLNADGSTVDTLTVGKQPGALAFAKGALWVSLNGAEAVGVYQPDGTETALIPVDFAPNGIHFDGADSIWVALQGNQDKPGNMVARIAVDSVLGN